MVKVKICGITSLEDALICSKEGADALGFIFSKRSPRCIKDKAAKSLIAKLDPFIVKVGVFIDEERSRVFDLASMLGLDVLQFHGKESPAYCRYFRRKFKVIKAVFPGRGFSCAEVRNYKVDALLFDLKYEEKLGRKRMLPKAVLKKIAPLTRQGERVIISGGLTPENVSCLKAMGPYGVDVASGVEAFVGKKDKNLVRLFIGRVK